MVQPGPNKCDGIWTQHNDAELGNCLRRSEFYSRRDSAQQQFARATRAGPDHRSMREDTLANHNVGTDNAIVPYSGIADDGVFPDETVRADHA